MSSKRSLLDPFGLVAELAAQIEKAGNRAGNRGMASPEFSAALNRALAASLGAKKLAGDARREAYRLLNVASHEDIVALQERLAAIDEKLLALLQAVERLEPKASAQASPAAASSRPRTRKPPKPAAGA